MEATIVKKEHDSPSPSPTNSIPSPVEQQNDCSTFGQSLIKFMTLATGSVKTALQKPANYKKNINHRRYLQKQLKICTRKKKRCTKTNNVAKKKLTESSRMLTRELYFDQANCVPLYATRTDEIGQFMARQELLAYDTSYETPVLASYQGFPNGGSKQGTFFGTPIGHDMPLQGCRDEILPNVFEDAGHFMSGEELTRTLDIKDLFVPERLENVINGESMDEQFHNSHSPNSLDGNHYAPFQTIPSTANVLSW